MYILILTIEGHRLYLVDIPMLLYTRWIGSIVKIYTLFHLHQQKWDSHRTNMGDEGNRESWFDYAIPKMEMVLLRRFTDVCNQCGWKQIVVNKSQ